ncbi:L,D-transpeptidase family protein [Tsuneonella sp. YG55]|uniref:L,D-transpeptidase family protein n=1 Tax=Tsuneonella litorea TaxID=2976475 RepID=A0A9X3ALR0_9SPHN|nr:L,D-transpeptidase family protein [Tsuneonella litorea]MCT2559488.1 L,D-transpeptidase family protein [Tsuneonella litorea]
MDSILKWLGGGVAAVLLGLGGAALATGAVGRSATDRSASAKVVPAAKSKAAAGPAAEAGKAPPTAAADTRFTVKRILPIDGPIKYGEWHWDDKGVPDGPLVMTVDLDARVLSVFKGGYEIGAAAVLIGTDEYPTPLGTFPILFKQRHNVSEKYDNAPMPWSMFLTRDGVAIHGGSVVENGYASHGCISGPDAFVSKIFAIAKPGDRVVITRGETIGMGDKIV